MVEVFLLTNDRIYEIMKSDIRNNNLAWFDQKEHWQHYYRQRFGIETESVSVEPIGSVWMTEENYTLYLLKWA